MKKNSKILLFFLWGLGSHLQIVSSLSFTELFVFAATPILIFSEWQYLRRNGVLTFFWLSMFLVLGCVVACFANHTSLHYSLRGMAVCCLMPCGIVVGHWLLRHNMNGFKWMLIGEVMSLIVCTYFFQKAGDVMLADQGIGEVSAESIMAGATYWKERISAVLLLPAKGWYLQCPFIYSVFAPIMVATVAMAITVSGRGTAVQAIASAVLILVGGRRFLTMRRIGKYFYLLCAVALVGAFTLKEAYRYAATNNWIGEGHRAKYENQTRGGKGLMALLLGGRMSSFCGLLACKDHPIIGFGPWAFDHRGYALEFMSRYGTQEDYERYRMGELLLQAQGVPSRMIPCHAAIVEMWCWYGIFGLIFCLYILFSLFRYLKQDCWAVPQWFFWIAGSAPGVVWNMCFNPLSARLWLTTFTVACLMVRAVRKGKLGLPAGMIAEIERVEREK